jgi:hypothetical protein
LRATQRKRFAALSVDLLAGLNQLSNILNAFSSYNTLQHQLNPALQTCNLQPATRNLQPAATCNLVSARQSYSKAAPRSLHLGSRPGHPTSSVHCMILKQLHAIPHNHQA